MNMSDSVWELVAVTLVMLGVLFIGFLAVSCWWWTIVAVSVVAAASWGPNLPGLQRKKGPAG